MRKHDIKGKTVLFYLFTVIQTSAIANISQHEHFLTENPEENAVRAQSVSSLVSLPESNNNSLKLANDVAKSSVKIDLLANAIRAARQTQQNSSSANNILQINTELSSSSFDGNLDSITDGQGLTRNQLSIGEALKEACLITDSQVLISRCAEIASLNDTEQKRVLNALIQDESAGTVSQMLRIGSTQFRNINKRISSLKSGKWGLLAVNQLSLNIEGEAVPIGTIAQGMLANVSGRSVGDSLAHSERLGFYLNGKVNFGDKKSAKNQAGFDFDTQGVTLGMDYRFSDQFIAGAALGYAFNDTNYNNKGGTQNQTSSINLYGSYFLPKNFYIDMISHFGYHASDNVRSIRYSNFSNKAISDTNGVKYGLNFSLGKQWGYKSWTISPYARFEFLEVLINNYNEVSNSGFAVAIDHTGGRSIKSGLGTQIGRAFRMSKGIIQPSLNFEWLHEFRSNATNISGRFLEASPGTSRFKLVADAPAHDFFNLGASVKATFAEGPNITLNHSSRLGQAGVNHYRLNLGVNIPF